MRKLTALPGCCQYDRAADVKEVKGNTVAKSQAAQTQQKKIIKQKINQNEKYIKIKYPCFNACICFL
jgi:hypothetical protein